MITIPHPSTQTHRPQAYHPGTHHPQVLDAVSAMILSPSSMLLHLFTPRVLLLFSPPTPPWVWCRRDVQM